MAARKNQQRTLGEEGQSILEFCFMLPVMVGLAMILFRVNTTIQMSIVNQQYARAQALFLTFNHSIYPYRDLRFAQLTRKGYNQMVIGVSDNPAAVGGYSPAASTFTISKQPGGSEETRKEPERRSNVRVRTTVSICTQPNVIGPNQPILDPSTGLYALSESTKFDLCRSPYL